MQKSGFSFERALSYPFTAPHLGSFPWLFGAAYAAALIAMLAVIGLFGWRDFAAWVQAIEALEAAGEPSPADVIGLIFGGMSPVLTWGAVAGLGSWVIWAMFETASQRRYIFGRRFSLGFGADELRMMVVGLLWGLMGFVIFFLPVILIFFSTFGLILSAEFEADPEAAAPQIIATVFGMFGLMVLLGPLYIFFATRLAPCFGMTLKEGRIVFFDAWGASRGRFWPIFGAYVILVICAGMISQVISGVMQVMMMPALMAIPSDAGASMEDVQAVLLSPGFLIPMGLLYFLMFFMQGLTQHVAGAPAALAARHDPRNDMDDAARVDSFS
ncbi:MAG: hypothetical protein ACK4P2_00010 [Hyphomonas sp.]